MSDLDQYPLRDTAIYNPHLLSKEELIGLFAVRRQLLERLLEDLSRCTPCETPQQHLLVAQRGMGKTMLLRRLQFAIEDDPELDAVWLPLTFPEEQYNVGGLSDLWLNCIDALGDALDRLGRGAEAERLDSQVETLSTLDEEPRARETLALLTQTASELGKRLVLLIDNIDLILERISGWLLLREALETVAVGRRSYLNRLAPEVRQPTEEILEQLGWEEPAAEVRSKRATAAPHRRTRRRSAGRCRASSHWSTNRRIDV